MALSCSSLAFTNPHSYSQIVSNSYCHGFCVCISRACASRYSCHGFVNAVVILYSDFSVSQHSVVSSWADDRLRSSFILLLGNLSDILGNQWGFLFVSLKFFLLQDGLK